VTGITPSLGATSRALTREGIDRVRRAIVPVSFDVIDPLGAGDAFAAGVLDGWLDGSLPEGLERGAILAAIVLAQAGDMLSVTRGELLRLHGQVRGDEVLR
jgi:sugar/nucleoside kinase (ribokinase family)